MYRQLAYLGLGAGAIATMIAVGCGGSSNNNNSNFDFSKPNGDASANMDGPAKTYMATTPHDVDTATIGSPLVTQGTAVSFSGLVVLAPPTGFSSKFNGVSKAGCRFEVWVQDPMCTTPPCGFGIVTQAMANPNASQPAPMNYCPYANELMDPLNVLTNTWTGDVIDVKGTIYNYDGKGSAFDGGPVMDLNEHEIQLDSITTTTTKGPLPTPTVVTDTTPSMFVPYTGSGWTMYEGMYITLKPASGKFTTSLDLSSTGYDTCPSDPGTMGKFVNGSFTVQPGGAMFDRTYNGFYAKGADIKKCFPVDGSMYSSISGIVNTGFGGSILPAQETDFAP